MSFTPHRKPVAALLAMTLAMASAPVWAEGAIETKKMDLMLKPTPEQLQSGAHGRVVLVGDLDASGAMTGLSVASSSGSSALDTSLLAKFEGGKVSGGKLPQQAKRIELSLTVQNFELKDGKTIVYACDQAVRDIDWSRSNVTNWDLEKEYLFGVFRVLGLIINEPRYKFVMNAKAYREAWLKAIDGCRNDESAFFIPLLMAAGNGSEENK